MSMTIQAPASKSVSHRALISAGLARGESLVRSPLHSHDLERTRACMETLGAVYTSTGDDLLVRGAASLHRGGSTEVLSLEVGESGTTCRLIAAVASAFHGRFLLSGQGRMHERPIRELTSALAPLGPTFDFLEKEGYPPLLINASGLSPGTVSIGLRESSQYLSGILLAAPLARGPLTVTIGGDKVVSWPYVGITLQAMADFGVPPALEVMNDDGQWIRTGYGEISEVRPGRVRFRTVPGAYEPREYSVEGDWSNASYFLAASALSDRPFGVAGLKRDSHQGDRAILDILERMGARVDWDGGTVTASRPGDGLHGIDVDMGSCPDLVPTVSVAASFARGTTQIRNVAHLRIKESDRLMAVSTQLARAGVSTELFEDGIAIVPGNLQAGGTVEITTFGDHRIAMSMSLLELGGVLVRLDDPACVAKSFPLFWEKWEAVRSHALR
jgi:3-phosphoshikimate 1-carboxyvinyltransferase